MVSIEALVVIKWQPHADVGLNELVVSVAQETTVRILILETSIQGSPLNTIGAVDLFSFLYRA